MKASHLHESDKRAVDMLLDELVRSSGESGFTASKAVVDPISLTSVRTVITRLDHYDVGEPPVDLAARTMAMIERAIGAGEATAPALSSSATADLLGGPTAN